MADIKELLDGAIEKELKNLNYASDGVEKSQVIKDLAQLHKLRIEEINAETEAEDKRIRRENEMDCKELDRVREDNALKQQVKSNKIDMCVRVGLSVMEIIVPLIFYGIWMEQGFQFERDGSFTSTTFKNLLSRFRPTK